MDTQASESQSPVLYFLGGLETIGQSCLCIEAEEQAFVIDCGIDPSRPGDVPDFACIQRRNAEVAGCIITHAHLDHCGALAEFQRFFPDTPVYMSSATRQIIAKRLNAVNESMLFCPDDAAVAAGPFHAELIPVNHSIPGAVSVSLAVSPGIRVLITGDIALHPGEQSMGQYQHLDDLDGLIIDSTGMTAASDATTEAAIAQRIAAIACQTPGRVFITCFSSNIQRIAACLEAARVSDRDVVWAGRTMESGIDLAVSLGYAAKPAKVQRYPAGSSRALYLVAGCQASPDSACMRLLQEEFVTHNDAFVYAAKPVPGHESTVSAMMNMASACTSRIYFGSVDGLHVSGHVARDAAYEILETLKPRWLIPVHGERYYCRMLDTPRLPGYTPKVIFPGLFQLVALESGFPAQIIHEKADTVDVAHERAMLAQYGVAFVVVPICNGAVGKCSISIRGVVPAKGQAETVASIEDAAEGAAENALFEEKKTTGEIRQAVREEIIQAFNRSFGFSPWVIVQVLRM